MDFVWFTSYLCIFMLGAIAALFTAYKTINHMVDKEEKKLVAGTQKSTLQERLEPYSVTDPRLN